MAYLAHIEDPSILCNSTVFSDMTTSAQATQPTSSPKPGSGSGTNTWNAPIFPVLPPAHNFSVLGNPARFPDYIASQLPLANENATPSNCMHPPLSPVIFQSAANTSGRIRSNVNSTFLNSLLRYRDRDQIIGPSTWFEDVFPDSSLPKGYLGRNCLKDPRIRLWDDSGNKISATGQPKDMSEGGISKWLNYLAANLLEAHNMQETDSRRGFDARSATKAVVGSFMDRKPDICVIDQTERRNMKKNEPMHWRKVYAIVEVTSQKASPLHHVVRQIVQKASCLFDVQPQRRYVCALGIFGTTTNLRYTFVVVDRTGITRTQDLGMETLYGFADFLRIVLAFSCGSTESLGWDPTMSIDPKTKKVTRITVTEHIPLPIAKQAPLPITKQVPPPTKAVEHHFDVIKILHNSPILFGRGTRVWIVKNEEGNYCVLKDSWILAENMVSEIEFVKHIDHTIKNHDNGYLFQRICPSYVVGQECVASTKTIRFGLPVPTAYIRHQRRIVTRTIGDPITSFRSKKEFVSVFLDLVNGMFLNYVTDKDG